MRHQGIAAPAGIEEYRLLVGAATGLGQEAVPGPVGQRRAIDLMPLGAAYPALVRQHHGYRFGGHQVGFRQGPGLLALHQRRTALVTIGLGVGNQLAPYRLAQQLLATQHLLQLVALLGQSILLTADLHFLQPRQLAQTGVEDVIGLQLAQGKAGHELGLRVFLITDDLNHLIQIEEGHQQAVQQVQSRQYLVQAELQAATHGGDAEAQPFAEQTAQILDRRAAVGADHVHVDPVAVLQVRGGEQVLHQLIGVHPVGARHDDHAGGVFMVGFIAQVGHQRQLLGLHLRGDLLHHPGAGDLVRQRGNDDIAILPRPDRATTHRPAAGGVEIQQLPARRDDFRFGREVRALDMLHQFIQAGARLVQQAHTGRRHFAQVMRWNVGGHAHGDAGGAVEQQVRQARRQHHGFFHGAVEVRLPVHGALPQLAQQHLAVAGQPGFGVTHGGKGLGIIRRAPVALAVDQRVAVGERLRHQHHGLVTGRVAMGVVFAQHVAHGARGFLVLGQGRQPQLAHGVDDAPLYRLEPVADMRQRAIHDHIHGVVQIGFFGKRRQ